MQTLLQGDAFALPKIFEYLADEYSHDNLHFALVCKQFYEVAGQWKHEMFERVIIFYERRGHVNRILHHPNYMLHLKEIEFFCAPNAAHLLVSKYCLQVEKLLVDFNVILLDEWHFPKLKHIEFTLLVNANPKEVIAKWISKAPNLKQVTLKFQNSFDPGLALEMEDLSSIVSSVPRVGLSLYDFDIVACLPYANASLTSLNMPCQDQVWTNVVKQCINLECLILNNYCTNPVIPPLQHLVKLQLQQVSFADKNSEVQFFQSIPLHLKELEILNMVLDSFPDLKYLECLEKLHWYYVTLSDNHEIDSCRSLKSIKEFCFESATHSIVNKLPTTATIINLKNCTLQIGCSLENVKELQLFQCKIISVDTLFANSSACTRIAIDDCTADKKELPLKFAKRTKFFSMATSEKNVIPVDIVGIGTYLTNVSSLILSSCNIPAFPLELGTLPFLGYLELSNNSISAVPDDVWNASNGMFPQLVQLFIDSNPIKSYPSFIGIKYLENLSCPLLSPDCFGSKIAPADIHRKEWQDAILQHMKYSWERYIENTYTMDGSRTVLEARIPFAIPMSNDRVMLNGHFSWKAEERDYYDFSVQPVDHCAAFCIIAHAKTKKILSIRELNMQSVFNRQ